MTLTISFLILFSLSRSKSLWLIWTILMMKFLQWHVERCLVAGREREPSPSATESQVCVAANFFSRVICQMKPLFYNLHHHSCVSWLIVSLWSRFSLQDSHQAHHAPWAHTVRDQPSVPWQLNSQEHLLAHRAFPLAQQREWVLPPWRYTVTFTHFGRAPSSFQLVFLTYD